MSYDVIWHSISQPAASDLSGKQFCFVTVGATGLALATTGGSADGVLQDKPTAGRIGSVCVSGISKVIVGAAGVTQGDPVASDSNGYAVTATTANWVLGKALSTGTSGVLVPVLLQFRGKI